MLLKGAYCVGEHFVDPQSLHLRPYFVSSILCVNTGDSATTALLHRLARAPFHRLKAVETLTLCQSKVVFSI